MEITEEYLRHRYSSMSTEELIDIERTSDLTELASRVIEDALAERGVTNNDKEHLVKKLEADVNKRSEGAKRLTTVLSFLFSISWVIFTTNFAGFSGRTNEIIIFFVGIPITFFIPRLLLWIYYWVKEGFEKDKET